MNNKIHLPIGTHIMADMLNIEIDSLDLKTIMEKAVDLSGAIRLHTHVEKFEPQGVPIKPKHRRETGLRP